MIANHLSNNYITGIELIKSFKYLKDTSKELIKMDVIQYKR